MKSDNGKTKQLCLDLIRADTEPEVIRLLRGAGYWDDAKAWRYLGDEEFNYSSVGNQQSRAEQAIIEKLINSIDAKLIGEARRTGCLPLIGSSPQASDTPTTIAEARTRFFGTRLNDQESLSRSITVAATGAKPKEDNGRPCFTIVDDGEGQTPAKMPDTILSLHKGNKDKIKFAQGKFNMGGTGVLEFCGMERNLQLVVSRRCPDLISAELEHPDDRDWSFTVIRRDDPTSEGKSSRFTYLAPVGSDARPGNGALLHFSSEVMALFPDKNQPYVRDTAWGTLLKLYEYDARKFATNMMFADGLMYRARLLLPQPALPIRFHECRPYRGDPNRSFDTTMVGLVETLQRDLDDQKRDHVEWFDKLPFDVDGEKFEASIYLFKNKDAADTYRRDEGILFTYNGQCHAVMTKDFFRRKKVKQDYLWHSLLLIVDCSAISRRAHEKLFMNSRDRLRETDLKAKLEAELEDQLGRHEQLRELASERRKKELAEQPKATESMAKLIENLLSKNPALAALLGQGMRIKNPHKPETAGTGIAGFIGKRFPTKFHFKGHEPSFRLIRDAYIGSHARITFETDAANDYFKRDEQPGSFELFRVTINGRVPATNYQWPRLHNGFAHLSLTLPDGASEGDDLEFEAVVADPSRVEPFVNSFILTVQPERETSGGGGGGRNTNADKEGEDGKGTNNKGSDQNRDGFLDIPETIPVYEKDWKSKEPEFDKFTCMRIKRQPDAKETEDRYDYFLNMDNVHLQTYLKARPKDAPGMKLRFTVGMTLVALAILHQEQLRKKDARLSEDMPDGKIDVTDRVAQVTSALAPFLLPMIDSVAELEDADEEESLSESAGEAA
ncbi:MAG: hypothetical protein ACOY3L_17940 [Pseudomonadota bacterium]